MGSRLATRNDTAIITQLLSELRGETVAEATMASEMADFLTDPARSIMLVTDESNQPSAMAILNLVYKLPKVECRVDEVVVAASMREKGYGSELMHACEDWAWEHHADVIEFTSRSSREAANRLYQKLGYDLRETNVYNKKQRGA